MSRCNTECDSFYKNPNESTFNSQGLSDLNMSCAYCLSNELEVSTSGSPEDLNCDCAKQLSSMVGDKNITFDQYNQIKKCLQEQGCSKDCKTLYNEFLGSGCGITQRSINTSTSGSDNTVKIILGVIFGVLALIGLVMVVRNLLRKPKYTGIPSSVRY